MNKEEDKYSIFSGVSRFRFRRIFYIAIFWTIIDLLASLVNEYLPQHDIYSLIIRECLVFIMSLIMGYLFVFTLRHIFRNSPFWKNFLAKTLILLLAAFIMNFFVHFVENKFIVGLSITDSLQNFLAESMHPYRLLRKTLYWIVLFVVTQLYIEINDKYSPGVFIDILAGKYIKPKNENRIVMFIDLKDSTPIA
ncbi:MAG: hypothetical protein ABIT07_11180, partial [Ferruginibacter sp.]